MNLEKKEEFMKGKNAKACHNHYLISLRFEKVCEHLLENPIFTTKNRFKFEGDFS